jgi:hypothetical protein
MSLREKINQNPQVAAMVAGGVALLAVIWIVWSIVGGGGDAVPENPNADKLYFSADDGASYTAGPAADRLKPGTVRAYVYTTGEGKPPFIGYLERYTAEGVAALAEYEKAIKEKRVQDYQKLEAAAAAGREVKKPKAANWVKSNAPEAAAVTDVRGPRGEEDVTEITPQSAPVPIP